MNKSVNLVASLLIIASLAISVSADLSPLKEQVNLKFMLIGAYRTPTDDEKNLETANDLLADVSKELLDSTLGQSPDNLVYFASQLVNGMNYSLILKNGENFTCAKIYKGLPVYGGVTKLNEMYNSTKDDICNKCFENTPLIAADCFLKISGL